MSLTAYEAETIINYNEEEKTATVYTHNRPLIKKLNKCCDRFPLLFKQERTDGPAVTFVIPKKYVSIREPKTYSQEQMERFRERGKKLQQQTGKGA